METCKYLTERINRAHTSDQQQKTNIKKENRFHDEKRHESGKANQEIGIIKLATCNKRSLRGKEIEQPNEMEKYDVDYLGIEKKKEKR